MLRGRLRHRLRRYGLLWRARRQSTRGVAAVEFAVILPVLVIILTSLADLTSAVLTWWQAAQAADAIGRIATSLAVTDSNANVLSQDQARLASTAVLPLLPGLRGSASAHAGVVLSAVVFTTTVAGCAQKCTYVANVAWSATLQGGLAPRACGVLVPAADADRPLPTTLAVSAYSADPLLIVDVATEFTPLMTGLLGLLPRFTAAGLFAARNGGSADWIHITGPTARLLQCPGYFSP